MYLRCRFKSSVRHESEQNEVSRSICRGYMANLISIVDDDPKSLKLMRDLCQASGYKTLEATDGEQGIELARLRKPDIILMDIQMPKMNGIEAFRILKADPDTSNIRVIALTSFAMQGDEEMIREVGFDAYLSKPVDIHVLLETVKKCLSGAGGITENRIEYSREESATW